MKFFLLVCGVLLPTICYGTTQMEVIQFAMFGAKYVNTFDHCYMVYGTPLVGRRMYDTANKRFVGTTTEWSLLCNLPWGRKEMDIMCTSFGYHTLHEDWSRWKFYDSVFNYTGPLATTCPSGTNVASLAECTYPTGFTSAACKDGNRNQATYYANFKQNNQAVLPVLFCQGSENKMEPIQCLNNGWQTDFTEALFWRLDANAILLGNSTVTTTGRKKRAAGEEEEIDIQVIQTNEEEDRKNILEAVMEYVDPDDNLLLADPVGEESIKHHADYKKAEQIKEFNKLLNEYGVEETEEVYEVYEEGAPDKKPRRTKRAVQAVHCRNLNFVTRFRNYGECNCRSGITGKFCEQDKNECLNNPNPCDTTSSDCVNTHTSYICNCKTGFTKNAAGACIDDDECLTDPCATNRNCVNTPGSFRCDCKQGTEVSGACVVKTKIVVKVKVQVAVFVPQMLIPGTAYFIRVCNRLKIKANQNPSNKLQTSTCAAIRLASGTGRRKRNAGELEADIQNEYSDQLSLAEQSAETVKMQDGLTTGNSSLDLGTVNGTDLGAADVTGRAQLVEATGLNLNNSTGGEDITEICYLYNLQSYCLQGSTCVPQNGMPTCQCAEGYSGSQCNTQIVSALSTSTIFLLAACIGLFFALLALCFSHVYHMRKLHSLEKFVGYRYHMYVANDERYLTRGDNSSSSFGDQTIERPRSWLPQPIRRHYGQSPAYFSHWG